LSERPHRVRTWAPRGQTPVLQFHFNWKTLSVIAGITWWNFYFKLFPGAVKAPQIIEFLRHLMRHLRRPLLVIWDGLPGHRSATVRDFVAAQGRRLTLEWLPGYAPELNPVEHIWGYLKEHELPNLCPRQLWQLDMTSVWVAEHGWCYLMAAIDCCTREIVAFELELSCRAEEAIALVERAAASYGIEPGELVLGTDNGPAFTARRFKLRLAELGIRHRRGGYRDPESQAFIESWFGKLKEREVWLNEYETLDDARGGIGGYVDRYHHRPHSGLDYRTPLEVRQTWEDLQKLAA